MIRQITEEIDCKVPRLKLLKDRVIKSLRGWPNHDRLHVKRDWNRSVDHLATMAMRDQTGSVITDNEMLDELIEINRLPELIRSDYKEKSVQVSIRTRSRTRSAPRKSVSQEWLTEKIVQKLRIERILKDQDEEKWIVDLKAFLSGDLEKLSQNEA